MLANSVLCCLVLLQAAPGSGDKPKDERDSEKRALDIRNNLAMIRNDKYKQSYKEDGVIIVAIRRLGRLKAEQAIPDLVEFLDQFVSDFDPRKPLLDSSYRCPAVSALVDIGEPAVPEIIKALAAKDRSPQFVLHAYRAIIRIAGTKFEDARGEAKRRIQNAIEKEKDTKTKERLKAALERMRTDDPKAKPPKEDSNAKTK